MLVPFGLFALIFPRHAMQRFSGSDFDLQAIERRKCCKYLKLLTIARKQILKTRFSMQGYKAPIGRIAIPRKANQVDEAAAETAPEGVSRVSEISEIIPQSTFGRTPLHSLSIPTSPFYL